jgi:hypothetical protein
MHRPRDERRATTEAADAAPGRPARARPPIGFASAPIVGLKSYRARISEAARRSPVPHGAAAAVRSRAPALRAALKPA